MKRTLLLAAVATLLFSCKKDEPVNGTFKGAQVTLHGGSVWSSIVVGADGKPKQLTLTLDTAVLKNVPVGNTPPPGHDHGNSIAVPLPAKALSLTPFQYLSLDWNPSGHDPAQVYDKPHFDIHYYLTTAAEVDTYTDMAKLTATPADGFLPQNHVAAGPVPKMGMHWVDLASPEFNGQGFSQTFLYGTYDAKVVFYEPMITLDFLKTTPSFSRAFPQPSKFTKAGYYPTRLRISKQGNHTEIILEEFVYRQAQ
jgi:hypothetical protein